LCCGGIGGGFGGETFLQRTLAAVKLNRKRGGGKRWQAGGGGTLLDGRNLSYRVTPGRSSSNGYRGSASASWQATYGTLGVGYNYDRAQHYYHWQLPCRAAGHAGGLPFSPPFGVTTFSIYAPAAQR
ncbi:fimbria/pilus outer membrane usher protein, partial [Salmonella enterica]|uniref:fimbria/pilus outer membrane usher protein n=1 Tax=Salmonella enterica TaxID=28901 RepID=UPI00398C7C50